MNARLARTLLAAGTAALLSLPSAAEVNDGASIDSAIAALYGCVTHAPGASPDFDRMRALVVKGGLFVPPRREGEDLRILDVDGFQDAFRKGVAARAQKGEPPSGFAEREVARHSDCFGGVCQVFSTYESRHAASDPTPFQRGINSIQLVKGAQGWRIASVVWDVETGDRPIPPERLKKEPAPAR